MISKELLSLVLDEDLQVLAELNNASLIIETDKDNNKLEVYLKFSFDETEDSLLKEINLDTLTRLCKEWCYSENYILESRIHLQQKSKGVCNVYWMSMDNDKDVFVENTELEAVIKATEFIARKENLL